ncbi:isochorismate synthase [Lysobacter maris]|uniref:isochorismate synthase n=1 Tax=Marilutibacter maris TaxID=1605891 RepID=A0A508B773_9GAMM|nr:isochorismate synthase [Lysobacter maris]KAB8198689.1 isochorismate synthase [Lysobacter maris]
MDASSSAATAFADAPAIPHPSSPRISPRPPRDALLDAWRPGDGLFSSPRQQLHCRGVQARLRSAANDGLADAADALLAGCGRDGSDRLPLIGAIPFDRHAPARLWLPQQAVFASGHARHRGSRRPSDRGGDAHALPPARSVPSASDYLAAVAQALARIERGELDKVVMSRCLRLRTRVDVDALLSALLARDPAGYTFAVDAGDDTRAGQLVGTSPELLLRKHGARVTSNPLAGSAPRSVDPDEDAHRAQALLASAKDRHEHALVVDAVATALAPWCRNLEVPATPSLLATPTMWHLSTRIDGTLADASTHALRLALQLHPTPAVCGHPTAAARTAIGELEGYDRDLFTGLVGWCDAHGDGEWAVTIRCALVEAEAATLYAGAGVVAGSTPEAELAETSAKLGTMLAAMGLPPLTEGQP